MRQIHFIIFTVVSVSYKKQNNTDINCWKFTFFYMVEKIYTLES